MAMKIRVGRPHYQQRGITICARWRDSYPAFLADVGPKPSPQHWLERIENDGDYEPGNVCWATITEQARNRRTNRLVAVNGETRCLAEWAKVSGVPGLTLATIWARLHLGWTPERAIFAPLRNDRRRTHA